jgi:choline monooxygenase
MNEITTPNGHTNAPLGDVLDALSKAAQGDFANARPIPAAVNHSQAFATHEREAVFMAEWICIGREDEIAAAGDFLTHDVAAVPVMVVRQANGDLQGFVNVCAHRFACLQPEVTGNAKRFMCRYHGWTYDLKGQLIAAPHMDMKEGFDRTKNGLRKIHVDTWQGFVYVCLADTPKTDISQALKPLTDNIVGRYNMSIYKTVLRETMVWDANWKNLIENFTESYHVPIAHKKTFALHKKTLSDYTCGEDNDHFGYHLAPQAADTGGGAAHPDNQRLEGEWRRTMVDFCVFPNHLITLMPDYLWWISVQPEGVGRFRATWGVAIPPEVLDDIPQADYATWLADLHAYMDVANDEDKVLVQALYQGTASTVLPQGTLHPIERNLWQFTRYLARVCCTG